MTEPPDDSYLDALERRHRAQQRWLTFVHGLPRLIGIALAALAVIIIVALWL